jgi:hypothetical protein
LGSLHQGYRGEPHEQKVPGVFDGLACGDNGKQRSDFKQFGAKCGGHGKSCAEVSRHRRLCDLPWATDSDAAECDSVSSVVCLCDFVLVCVLATANHGDGARAGCEENAAVRDVWTLQLRLAERVAGIPARSAGNHVVRRQGVQQKGSCLMAWMQGQLQMMMMSFICSCRNKNERKAIYPKVLPTIRSC